jgi:hypothetical protein
VITTYSKLTTRDQNALGTDLNLLIQILIVSPPGIYLFDVNTLAAWNICANMNVLFKKLKKGLKINNVNYETKTCTISIYTIDE